MKRNLWLFGLCLLIIIPLGEVAAQTSYEPTNLTVILINPEVAEVSYGFTIQAIMSNGGTGERAWFPDLCIFWDVGAFRFYPQEEKGEACHYFNTNYLMSSVTHEVTLRPNMVGNFTIGVVGSAQNAETVVITKTLQVQPKGDLYQVPVTTHHITTYETIESITTTSTYVAYNYVTETTGVCESYDVIQVSVTDILLVGAAILSVGAVLGAIIQDATIRIKRWKKRND
jgi:hypothetical protein